MDNENVENINETLKDIMGENYQDLSNRAMICEVGYFIGKHKEIDDYVHKKIIDEVYGVDEYVLFYIFCEFIVNNAEYKDLQDLYEMLEDDYVNAVDEFMKRYTEQ